MNSNTVSKKSYRWGNIELIGVKINKNISADLEVMRIKI